ncbi:hypothetical protein MLD38_025119 [Melastoma candidum]|nr:hypothetical protein MLD38_025119 [Melastoma candidum]
MAEDQSVVGRRRIYYDQHGSEALICSDSEEDVTEADEEKHDYSEGEDRIIWMAFEEHGCCEDVQRILSQQIGVTAEEVQDRYKFLKLKYAAKISSCNEKNEDAWINGLSPNKTLTAALDSLDNLFCRRCLLFDCRLHGCSQSLVFPSEKQVSVIEQGDKKPCGDHCHLQLRPLDNIPMIESGREKVEPVMSSIDEAKKIVRESWRIILCL